MCHSLALVHTGSRRMARRATCQISGRDARLSGTHVKMSSTDRKDQLGGPVCDAERCT